jgi:uncharacterized surface protein with fasciclin (FAS1) repeats
MIAIRRSAIVALSVAALLTLSACSSGTEEMTTTETTAAAEATEGMDQAAAGTIVDVAVGTEGFATLVAALTAAELVETLSGAGPFTVFAPTDAAFAALPAGVLDALLLPANKAILVKILTYHVVSGKVMAADVADGDVATVEGQTVKLSTMNGVMVNEANVTATDIAASNGVIHVIDAVLVPSDVDVAALLKK